MIDLEAMLHKAIAPYIIKHGLSCFNKVEGMEIRLSTMRLRSYPKIYLLGVGQTTTSALRKISQSINTNHSSDTKELASQLVRTLVEPVEAVQEELYKLTLGWTEVKQVENIVLKLNYCPDIYEVVYKPLELTEYFALLSND